ncbi:MAG TPA: DUF1844 domain-containing protein [Pyrinomonadaceae bacterium]|nr:DUF1844 domain-containing protein [Pyrinomonadaceae bacterium]
MNEEKPTFKITDRRLFNTDGSPRDVEREEESVTTSTETNATPAAPVSDSSRAAAPSQPPPEDTVTSYAGANLTGEESSDVDDLMDDAVEPSGFVNLVMFIASPAAAALGMTEHPEMAGHGIDLPFAKHCIDLLGALREKTGGNLSAQEGKFLDGLLAELRMQYVSLSTARPAAAPGGGRGFSGSDITGGR